MAAQSVGLVGLGLLGTAIAERLLQGGFAVVGFDVDPDAVRRAAEHGCRTASSAREVARGSDRVILSLPNAAIVELVLKELAAEFRDGLIIIDTTTGEPACSEARGSELIQLGVHYLDATVSGSSEQVRLGHGVLMIGGERDVSESSADLFASFARAWYHIGPWGSGAKMKLVVNLVLGLNRAALAEGLGLARASGLDLHETLQVLQAGAAYSKVMDAKGRKMIEREFAPQAKLSQHLKDVRLILAHALRMGAKVPLSTLHADLLTHLEAAGWGEMDDSAVINAFDQ